MEEPQWRPPPPPLQVSKFQTAQSIPPPTSQLPTQQCRPMDAGRFENELLSSLVADIKNYGGSDPLRPWLQGIRRMRTSLPPQILKEKIPRFLQKCAEAFESDRRYGNDPRYLRVWIELMDCVDDAMAILRRMEKNGIGLKRATFYLAYAMYYEKQQKFEEAEKMYYVGVQNLAEPATELQKSYEKFLRRRNLYKKRKAKAVLLNTEKVTSKSADEEKNNDTDKEGHMQIKEQKKHQLTRVERASQNSHCSSSNIVFGSPNVRKSSNHSGSSNVNGHKRAQDSSDETVVVKFVDSAIVGKSEAEDACHHGLVDPTVNMKEAMNAISSMFRLPLEPESVPKRKSNRGKPKANQESIGFEVFIDDGCCNDVPNICYQSAKIEQNYAENPINNQHHKTHETSSFNIIENSSSGEFKILADDDEELGKPNECSNVSANLKPDNHNSQSCRETELINSELDAETVFQKFVGSTVFGEHKVENACHHGLIDPTISLKEALDDINSMFGEPLNFEGDKSKKRQDGASAIDHKLPNERFSILADDDIDDPKGEASWNASSSFGKHGDLFEPTIFTKEAMDEINELFGKPLDF